MRTGERERELCCGTLRDKHKGRGERTFGSMDINGLSHLIKHAFLLAKIILNVCFWSSNPGDCATVPDVFVFVVDSRFCAKNHVFVHFR